MNDDLDLNFVTGIMCENIILRTTEAELKVFKARLEFETRLKHGWFHLKLYSVFQDFSRRSIRTSFWLISDRVKIL